MTNEELVLRIKAGETSLMDELWSQVERFVYKQAYKFFNSYRDRCERLMLEVEDLYQEGYLAIQKAVEKFNPDMNKAFLTYAGFQLKSRFFDVGKMHSTGWQNDTTHYAKSLDEPTSQYQNETTLLDTLADETSLEDSIIEQVYTENLSQDLQDAMTRLTERQAYVIAERYFKGLSLSEIARQIGVSKTVVCKSHTSALAKLRISGAMQSYLLSA